LLSLSFVVFVLVLAVIMKRSFSMRTDGQTPRTEGGFSYKAKRAKMAPTPAVRKYVKKTILDTHEPKYVDDLNNPINPDYDGILDALSHKIVQGDSMITRDGAQVHMTGIDLSGSIVYADATNFVRCLIFQWHENSAHIAPTASDLITSISTAHAPLAPLVDAAASGPNFKVLLDRTWRVEAVGPNTAQFTIKLRGNRLGKKVIKYNGGAATCTDGLYILWVSDSAAASNPTVTYSVRQHFKDV